MPPTFNHVDTVAVIEAYPTGAIFRVHNPAGPIFSLSEVTCPWMMPIILTSTISNRPIEIIYEGVGSGAPAPNGVPTALVIAIILK